MDAGGPYPQEVVTEQAHALARETGQLAASLRDLERAAEIAACAPRLPAAAPERDTLLHEAQDLLCSVITRREAMGIVHHARLYEVLRVPPEVRARLVRQPIRQ